MKKLLTLLIVIPCTYLQAQNPEPLSIFDGRAWGVVLQHPEMKNVLIKKDIPYLSDSKGTLKMDVYLPPTMRKNEKRPAVIFLNAIGDQPTEMKVKSWGIYKTWPQLVAAHGYVGISMECDGSRIQESITSLFTFLATSGSEYNVDADKLGIYAASANVTESVNYLMGSKAHKGIKAAVLYYGGVPQGPFRKDLPVYFIVAEGDVGRTDYRGLWSEVMKNRAPWTIQMASNLIHGFDAFNENDEARQVVKQTISFWKNHLDPIPSHTWPNTFGREVLAAQYGNNYKEVVRLLRPWISEHPQDVQAMQLYGTALRRNNEYGEAEPILKNCLETKPQDAFLLSDLVVTEYALNKPSEGEVYLKQLQESGQTNPYLFSNLGLSLFQLNRHKEGIPLFEKSLTIMPNAVNYYNLACGYSLVNEIEKAIVALEKAIDAGFTSKQQFETDPDLAPLKEEDRFKALLAKLK
jgi:Flp pilus assembly protein TadD